MLPLRQRLEQMELWDGVTHPPHPSRVGMLVPRSALVTGVTSLWEPQVRERSPVLGYVELMEGFPVAEVAGNVAQLSLGPRECLCALVQPCICMAQRMNHAGPNPAQQKPLLSHLVLWLLV